MLRARILDKLSKVTAAQWRTLRTDGNPFVSHAFLEGLERHGCIRPELGWAPFHATLWRGEELVAAAPTYLKGNSHGEFVFDHAWAEAHSRVGLDYFPKLLVAVPYSPVPGPRLLLREGEPASTRALLAECLADAARQHGYSSVHVNFVAPVDCAELDAAQWLERYDWQFHWHNRAYADFEGFLAALNSKRRKEIRRERRPFADARWSFRWHGGAELEPLDIDFLHECYARAFAEKGNYPALTRGFFAHLAAAEPEAVRALIVSEHGERVAMAFCLQGPDTLYGRYWGALRHVPGLHFEACYYRGIEHCIAAGLARFEPGAQGEHKLARGFIPTRTQSWHWIADPRLREGISRSLVRERAWLSGYRESLLAHTPFARKDAGVESPV